MNKIDIPAELLALHADAITHAKQAAQHAAKANGSLDPQAFWADFGDSHELTVAEDGTSAELTLYGNIGGFFGIDGTATAKDIRGLDAAVTDLDVRLDSGGGSVFDAILVYNALVDSQANVTVTVDAMAASAASFLLQAGDQRVMNRGAMAMVHGPWVAAMGGSDTMRAAADFLDKNRDNMAGIYAARSGSDTDHWLAYMQNEDEHWFTAAEAVDVGLADTVVTYTDSDDGSLAGLVSVDEARAAEGLPPISPLSVTPDSDPVTATAVDPAERQRQLEEATASVEAAKARALASTN